MKSGRRRALSLGMGLALAVWAPLAARAAWENPFRDVGAGDWFYGAVEYVNTAGLFDGTGAEAFSPNEAMTRGMFVKVLGSAAGVVPGGEPASRFADVPGDAYYAPYVAWAAETGVVKGTSDTTFSPEEAITREDMAVMLYQYAEARGFDTSYEEEKLEAFPDSGEVAGYAQAAMAWAVTHGALAGSGGYLEPKGVATRAETAQIFYNGREVLGMPEESPGEEVPGEEESPGEESPGEESPGEEVPPVVDTTPDAPWLEEQRKELEGGTHTLSGLGVTRAALLNELEAHDQDNYYLGTPYVPGDWQSPKGDTRYNGRAGMNCGGFVSYVLRKAGLRAEEAMGLIKLVPGQSLVFGSGKAYDLLAGASNYRNLIKNGGLEAYVFSSPEKLLASGKAEKGDVLFIDKGPGAGPGDDTHIGFYWEDAPERAMWHSGSKGNGITAITAATADPVYILIKID